MLLQVVSDLHIDVGGGCEIPVLGDCLVIAGDIGNVAMGVEYKEFLDNTSKQFARVVVVPGNHEFYGGEIASTKNSLCGLSEQFDNVEVLDNKTTMVGGIMFVGSTLWSNITPSEKFMVGQCLNDYRAISNGDKQLTTCDTIGLFCENVLFIGRQLKYCKRNKIPVVVVTHHAPTTKCHPRFYDSGINSAFGSDLTDIIMTYVPSLWIHGHTHDNHDYMVGGTRVVCNPRGYPNENSHFDSSFTVEI